MSVQKQRPSRKSWRTAFTLIELMVVIAIIAVLATLLLPVLGQAKSQAQAVGCLNNVRQLDMAWLMYAHEQRDHLAYNLGGDANRQTVAPNNPMNWVNGVMSWELDPDNTNREPILQATLAPYCYNNTRIYKCPSDRALSDIQSAAGWTGRVRSYSMNAMVGDAGTLSQTGTNVNNPNYKQFFRLTDIPNPASIFVFLDEHPDSINDGYFLVRPNYYYPQWFDLPASYHNHGAEFAYADGHADGHKWVDPETLAAAQPDAAGLPRHVAAARQNDFKWILQRTSVQQGQPSTSVGGN